MTVKEKRKHYRHPIRLPIQITKEEGHFLMTRSADLSLGGLGFVSQDRLEKGHKVKVNVPYKRHSLRIDAEVVYSMADSEDGLFRTGLVFRGRRSRFRDKLAGQILDIVDFGRKLSERFGRQFSEEEAADLWVDKYARRYNVDHDLGPRKIDTGYDMTRYRFS